MTQHYSPVILTCKWNMIIQEYIKKNKILYKQSILHFLHCYVTMSVYRNVPGIVHVLFILTLFLHPLPSSKDPSISLYPPNIPFSPGSPVFFFWSLNVHPQHVLEAFLCSSKSIRICCFSSSSLSLGHLQDLHVDQRLVACFIKIRDHATATVAAPCSSVPRSRSHSGCLFRGCCGIAKLICVQEASGQWDKTNKQNLQRAPSQPSCITHHALTMCV